MKLRLSDSAILFILSFLLGKLSGMLVVGHWSAVGDHWLSLAYSAIMLPVLFILVNTYDDLKARRKARRA